MAIKALDILPKLSEAPGISGREEEVRNILREIVGDHVDELKGDTLGNLIAYKQGTASGDRIKVMIAAHMDEVGLMVSAIEKNGLLKFKKVGGIDDRVLVSKTVFVGPQRLPGVIGAKAIHLQKPAERKKVIEYKQLYIDLGFTSKEEAEKKVSLGDPVVFATEFANFGKGLVKGKAFDDRVGCALLAQVLQDSYPFDLYGVFTVQEEVGLRGAVVSAYAVEPDIGIALEGTTCADIPESKPHGHATTLGGGPAISLMDRTSIGNKRLIETLMRLAEKEGIPYQFRRTTAGGNDAGPIHMSKAGRPAVTLSVPCRYIHSPVSVIDTEDLANAGRLLKVFLDELGKGGVEL